MVNKLIFSVHRILGTLLSILFLMWFLSGIVMIYHHFPSANREEKLSKLQALPTENMPSIDQIVHRTAHPDSVTGITARSYLGTTSFEISEGMNRETICLDSTALPLAIDSSYICRVAHLWCDANIEKIDTLNKLEQWIPFGKLKDDMPIYKFYFADSDKTQLYISSVTGEVLQQTTHEERVWAWLGPIPHWVYFTWLRQDVDLWKNVIIWISLFGIVMIFAGFYVAVKSFRQRKDGKPGLRSVYKKRWYRWHHIVGTAFGVFVLTWIFSGMMSLADTPDWLAPEHKKYDIYESMRVAAPKPADYPLDYRKVISHFAGRATQIEWTSFFAMPTYTVQVADEEPIVVDASGSEVKLLNIEKNQVEQAIAKVHEGEKLQITMMNEYDNYYLDRKQKLPLPVWKVKISNADNTVYYVNPQNGNLRSFNNHSRWSWQMYHGLHSLRYRWLVNHPVVWTVTMWSLLIFGAFISLSGVVLGLKYIKRLCKKAKKR